MVLDEAVEESALYRLVYPDDEVSQYDRDKLTALMSTRVQCRLSKAVRTARLTFE